MKITPESDINKYIYRVAELQGISVNKLGNIIAALNLHKKDLLTEFPSGNADLVYVLQQTGVLKKIK
jgi:hypothetical protein